MAAGKHAPFQAHKKGSVRAHGTISEVRIHEDGKTARVTVRHKAPPKPKEKAGKGMAGQGIGMMEYPEETSATMPAEHAKRFTAGQNVAVHIGPAEEIGDAEEQGGEESAESTAMEAAERAPAKKKTGSMIARAMAKGAAKK